MGILENYYAIFYGKILIEFLLIFIIYRKVKKHTKDFSFLKFKKLILYLVLTIFISSGLGMYGLSIISGVILIMYPLSNILAYPQEFRNFLDDYHQRKVSKKNVGRLISDKNIEALADTIVNNYRKKQGSVYVITREHSLTEMEDTGYSLGSTEINSELMELLYTRNSPLGKGAVIIRDNKIVSCNSKLYPIIDNQQLSSMGAGTKHLGMLGVVTTTDAVVIGTSGDSGYITIGGTRPDGSAYFRFLAKMQEHDLQNGLSKSEIVSTIKILLEGVGNPEDIHLEKEREEEKQRKLEEASRLKLEKARNVKSKEQKIEERNEKRNKKKSK